MSQAILAPLETFWSCLSITSDRALQTLQTRRLWCGGDERMSFCSWGVLQLGHNPRSPSYRLCRNGEAGLCVAVVITEISVHDRHLGYIRVFVSLGFYCLSVVCWLFSSLSLWSVDVASSLSPASGFESYIVFRLLLLGLFLFLDNYGVTCSLVTWQGIITNFQTFKSNTDQEGMSVQNERMHRIKQSHWHYNHIIWSNKVMPQ